MNRIKVFIYVIAIFLLQNNLFAQFNFIDVKKEPIEIDLEFTFITSLDFTHSANEQLLISDINLGLYLVSLDENISIPISGNGKGPGEYESLDDIYISTITNEMLLLDSDLSRISFFSSKNFDYVDSYSIITPKNAEDGSVFSPYRIWDFKENDSLKYIVGYTQSYNYNTQLKNRKKRYILFDEKFNVLDLNYLTLRADEDNYYIAEPSGGYSVGPRPFGRMSLVDFTTKGEAVMIGFDTPCIRYNKKENCLDFKPIEISEKVDQLLKSNSYFNAVDLSTMDDTFPYFNEMYITEDEYVWLSRYSNLEYTEIVNYSLSRNEITSIYRVPGFLKLLTVVDNVLYMSTYPYIMDIPQIYKVKIN